MTKDKVSGILRKIVFKNPDNFFHILSIEEEEGGLFAESNTVLISQAGLFEGVSYEFIGEWVENPKFGKQFKATIANEIQPSSIEGLKMYLSSGFFPGIGPVIATRIINHFGDSAVKVFSGNLERLMEVKGIAKKKLASIKTTWEKNREINAIMMFLQQYGISPLLAGRIYNYYGNECVAKIKENPYRLAYDVDGISFKKSDEIALQLGFDVYSIERLKAGILYTLEQSTTSGHCYLTTEQLTDKTMELLNIHGHKELDEALEFMITNNYIKFVDITREERGYYAKHIYFNEIYCAEKLHTLKDNKVSVNVKKEWLSEGEIELSEEQKKAVYDTITNSVSVLTGGPGTGKTQTTRKIVEILIDKLGMNVLLCAPTGRAAQRMTELIGVASSTIHRLLGWDPVNKRFLHNEMNQLDADFFIVDETSMVDINLAADFLKAIPNKAQILFCGDADQLEPVGPGNFFKDLINSKIISVHKLTRIYRQAAKSLIIKYAHEINHGTVPQIINPLMHPKVWEEKVDCLFIDSGFKNTSKQKHQYPKSSSLRYNMDVKEMILKLYTDIIPKYYGDKEIQVLIPMNIGPVGTVEVNKTIQEAVNPKSPGKPEITIREKLFRMDDKIIQTRNNYDIGTFNGDIGRIMSIDLNDIKMLIKFSDDRIVEYSRDDMLDLSLAYAISIHKSQGSEFSCVILPLTMQYQRMLQRRLVYTAITRAKELVVFVGQRTALADSVNNMQTTIRQTYLKERLLQDIYSAPI